MPRYLLLRMSPRLARLAVVVIALGLAAGDALAQRPPYRERPDAYSRDDDRGGRQAREHEAGRFDYYVLVLSWSPTYCALGEQRSDPQCSPRGDRPYAFVLHGLWPQHERGWPQDCRTRERPFVPRPTIDRMLDIMPSRRLVIHEYRKHGTCSGLASTAITTRAQAVRKSRCAAALRAAHRRSFLTFSPGELKGLHRRQSRAQRDMIAVPATAQARACGGARLLRRAAIPRLRPQRGPGRLCCADRMYVPPVRVGARSARRDFERIRPSKPPAEQGYLRLPPDTLPGPRGERRM